MFDSFVKNVVEVLLAADWAGCLLLLKPLLDAGLTEVVSTALGEVRVAENPCAYIAIEPFRDWPGKGVVISAELNLVRDDWCCHFEFERLKSVVHV